MRYTRETRAMYYDCDVNNRLKISAAMQYMQQTSSEQMECMGISPEKLMAEDMVFLLSQSGLMIHRMPLATEPVKITTAATSFRGARFVREFAMESWEGERLLSASTLWLLVHPSNRKIIRPNDFPYKIELEPSFVSNSLSELGIPKRPENANPHVLTVPVRYSHLDCNRHVNNAIYADFICDVLEYDDVTSRGIRTVLIKFQNEAKLSDELAISRYKTAENDEYYIEGEHGRASCFQAYVQLG